MADGDQLEAAKILAGLWVEEQKTHYTLLEVRGPNQPGYKEQMESWRASTLSKGRLEGVYEVILKEINELPTRARQRQQLNELQDTVIPSAAESSTDSIATINSLRPTSAANNTERSASPDQTSPLAQGTDQHQTEPVDPREDASPFHLHQPSLAMRRDPVDPHADAPPHHPHAPSQAMRRDRVDPRADAPPRNPHPPSLAMRREYVELRYEAPPHNSPPLSQAMRREVVDPREYAPSRNPHPPSLALRRDPVDLREEAPPHKAHPLSETMRREAVGLREDAPQDNFHPPSLAMRRECVDYEDTPSHQSQQLTFWT